MKKITFALIVLILFSAIASLAAKDLSPPQANLQQDQKPIIWAADFQSSIWGIESGTAVLLSARQAAVKSGGADVSAAVIVRTPSSSHLPANASLANESEVYTGQPATMEEVEIIQKNPIFNLAFRLDGGR